MSDANFAAHVEDQKSVSGWSVFLNSAWWEKSCQQNFVTLSVTEAELIAASECTQDMIQTMQIVTSLGLKEKTIVMSCEQVECQWTNQTCGCSILVTQEFERRRPVDC